MAGVDAGRSFSGVSRFRGQLFAALARAASWFGIVVLALLLAMVTIDALGLGAASTGWFVGLLVGFGVPVALYSWYVARSRPSFGPVALKMALLPAAGVFFAAGLFVLLVVLEPLLLFVYYTFAVFPAGVVYWLFRRQQDGRAPLFGVLTGVVGIAASSYIDGVIPIQPLPWITYLWALVIPAGLVLAILDVEDRRNRSLVVGAVVIGGILAAQVLPLLFPISPEVSVLLYVAIVLPTARYAGLVLDRKRETWPGLLAPLVVIGGGYLGFVLADVLGTRSPDVWLDWQFLTSSPSTVPEQAGLYPAIVGSVFIIAIVAVVSFVVGVGAAIYLEEYAPSTGWGGTVTRVVRVNIANLAGVPSVVYGLLGLGLFVNLLGMGLGIVIVAALTLSLLILPIVIISAQEAIRSVPTEVRQASYGLGATKWQTIRNVVLPRAVPGILTGTILALSRAIGETAPLLMIGAATTVFSPPETLTSQVSAMPLQVFYWSFASKSAFREVVAPAGVVTLLVVMLSMNGIAIYLRNRYEQRT